jgi:hypothetical protein
MEHVCDVLFFSRDFPVFGVFPAGKLIPAGKASKKEKK